MVNGLCIALDYIGYEMQLVLPNVRATLSEKKLCHKSNFNARLPKSLKN